MEFWLLLATLALLCGNLLLVVWLVWRKPVVDDAA